MMNDRRSGLFRGFFPAFFGRPVLIPAMYWRDVTLTGELSETMCFPGCDTTCAEARLVNDRGRT
jgi:hypothetical protein